MMGLSEYVKMCQEAGLARVEYEGHVYQTALFDIEEERKM